MQFPSVQKLFSLVAVASISLMGVSHGFMKIETEQIFSPQDQTIQTISYMDMSEMFDQFEAMGVSLDDLSKAEQAQLESSFDGMCDQMEAQIMQTTTLQPEITSLSKDTRTAIKAMQSSFSCKKIGFGKFEIGTTVPLKDDAYKIENEKFIMEANDSTMTPEMKQQLEMLMNQQIQADTMTAEQIEKMKDLGLSIKINMVFPGKVIEANVGEVNGNTVTIDMWKEIIAMMEQGSGTDFVEKFMNMRIVSEIDEPLVAEEIIQEDAVLDLNPTMVTATESAAEILLEDEIEALMIDFSDDFSEEELLAMLESELVSDLPKFTTSKEDSLLEMLTADESLMEELTDEEFLEFEEFFELDMNDEELLFEKLLLDESLMEKVSDEELESMLAVGLNPKPNTSFYIPIQAENNTNTPSKTTNLITVQPVRSEPKTIAPLVVRSMDKQTIEEEIINNIFAPEVFEENANSVTKKTSYSPDRVFNNIKAANAARQAKKGNSTNRYTDFFRSAAK